jgi:hypothetical protein
MMKLKKSKSKKRDGAASEVIGTVLMISLVAIAIGIISVVILSQPVAQKIPEISPVITRPISGDAKGGFALYHNGGDELLYSSAIILDTSGPVPASRISLIPLSGASPVEWQNGQRWKIGSTLLVKPAGTDQMPDYIAVAYRGGTSSDLLFAEGSIGANPTPAPTVTPSRSPTASPTVTTTPAPPTPTTTTPVTPTTTVSPTVTMTPAPPTPTATTTPVTPTPTPTSTCGTISGRVFNDLNGNGQDDNEPGLAGYVVQASGSKDSYGKATSDQNGNYLISGLGYQPAEKYQVWSEEKSGWQTVYPACDTKSCSSPATCYCLQVQLNPPGSFGQPEKCYETGVTFGKKPVSTPTPTKTPTVTPTPTPMPSPSPTTTPTVTPIEGHGSSITLNKQGIMGTVIDGTMISLRVRQDNSYIAVGDSEYDFQKNDQVDIIVRGDQSPVWIDNSNTMLTTCTMTANIQKNGVLIASGTITKGNIQNYDKFSSTLVLQVPRYLSQTQLVVDGKEMFKPWDPPNNAVIILKNIAPSSSNTMQVHLDPSASSETYVVCSADYVMYS